MRAPHVARARSPVLSWMMCWGRTPRCHLERSGLRGRSVGRSPEGRMADSASAGLSGKERRRSHRGGTPSATTNATPPIGGPFDSFADSLAQGDMWRVNSLAQGDMWAADSLARGDMWEEDSLARGDMWAADSLARGDLWAADSLARGDMSGRGWGSTPLLRMRGSWFVSMKPPRPGRRAGGATRDEDGSDRHAPVRGERAIEARCHGWKPWLPGRFALKQRMEPDPKHPCHPRNPRPKTAMVRWPVSNAMDPFEPAFVRVPFAMVRCLCDVFAPLRLRACDGATVR
jgi:hypothetical protein